MLLVALSLFCGTGGAAFTVVHHLSGLATLGVALAGLVALIAVNMAKRSVIAIPALAVFGALMGATSGPMVALYLHMPHGPHIVAAAALSTAFAALAAAGLAMFAVARNIDLSVFGQFLFIGLLALLGFTILGVFIHLPALQLTVAALGVLIFSGYLVFDLWRIERQNFRPGAGDFTPAMAACTLYLDLLNLFQFLLEIFAAASRD